MRSLTWMAACLALVPSLARGATTADVRSGWTSATGPVDHYELEVSVDGGAFAKVADVPATTTATAQAQFTATVGSTIKARVRAIGTNPSATPTLSSESDPLTVFDMTPLGTPGKPTLIIIQIVP